ncbi:Tetratricopeptide repeat-containing protein [Catalinimonas alkaloidigena]|uniref:Tetratricopeptide repeat-containing protein n=1 Tax=Catalinimonas alkaloidigena TaxID=1075417 RepID=A0A1G9EV55_9BACT|nr:tetratricopeptide repeat protein [Catalinimonas alkaloidigena]SDK80046.1 Tetratricopeptide repeat-containing protein [Catalinimonas alkaloidigena]
MRKKNTFASDPSWVRVLRKSASVALLGCALATNAWAQSKDLEIAKEYVQNEDYVKAEELLTRLAKSKENYSSIYDEYMLVLTALKKEGEKEKFLKKYLKEQPDDLKAQADYGLLLLNQGAEKSATAHLQKLVERTQQSARETEQLASYLSEKGQNGFALKVYEAAQKSGLGPYHVQISNLYYSQGDVDDAIQELVSWAEEDPEAVESVQNTMQNFLRDDKERQQLEKILIEKTQKKPNEIAYNQLLLWLYIQDKDFYGAFIQAKAIDRRERKQGGTLFETGEIALKNGDFEAAEEIFGYLTKEYRESPFYSISRRYYIEAKEEAVKRIYPVDEVKIQNLIQDYVQFAAEVPNNEEALKSLKNVAELYAFYLHDLNKAKEIIREILTSRRVTEDFLADCKLLLGDVYLLAGEPWESTLLYAQVEKSLKDTPKGHEAKLRNAKLNFYKGDFELAQGHLDILKMATSREIANDAMELSLLIQDNLALDTNTAALQEYARIELLQYQNQLDEAYSALDSMLVVYPNHSLTDEIYWLKGRILEKEGKTDQALTLYQKVVDQYGQDLYGDDALYRIGRVQEEKKKDKEKAMEAYQRLMRDYPSSIHTQDARRRFRNLRGDVLN